MDFLDYCEQSWILLAVFPPRSLSSAYSRELTTHTHDSQARLSVNKGDFFPLFWKAWTSSFTEKTILKSFEATGIWPIDPKVVLERFTKTTLDEQESRESSASRLSESDWRKMRELIRVAIKEGAEDEAKKLSLRLHRLQVQNELLRYENEGLKESLVTKKKHDKHSKPLDLQQREEYHGGAVFWSPGRVREARTRQTIKEREEKEEQHQKSQRKEQQRLEKERKEREKQEKREGREAAKAVKEKEKADLTAERERKKQENNANKASQTSHLGKRKASKPPKRVVKRQKQVVDAVGGGKGLEVTSEALTRTTSRGRNVNLPSKFR